MTTQLYVLISFLSVLSMSSSFAARENPRPSDWISSEVPVLNSHVEVIELPYTAAEPEAATLLMIPGLFQNASSFDLLPEENISVARHLMNRYHLHIYFLNVRGLGNAGSGRKLSIDDFAIDDIPAAVSFVSKKVQAPIYVFGHSQGAIELQASMAGLTRCSWGNCFQADVAQARQALVKGIALSAGSVTLASENPHNGLPFLGQLGGILQAPFSLLDYIRVSDLVTLPGLSRVAYSKMFEFLYHRPNTSAESELALYQRTLESSWSQVILQFAEAVRKGSVVARETNPFHRRERYVDALVNLQRPVVQVTYELDPMAEPGPTLQTSFNFIGSTQKKFFKTPGQGHEDFMMVESMHADWDEPMEWLLAQ